MIENLNQILWYKNQLGKAIHCYGDEEHILRFYPVQHGSYYHEDLEIIDSKFIKNATFEDKIQFIEKELPWGRIVKTHCIGDIQIIEWHNDKNNVDGFSIYVDFESKSMGSDNLDDALISAIALKYNADGAIPWILKMLGRLKE